VYWGFHRLISIFILNTYLYINFVYNVFNMHQCALSVSNRIRYILHLTSFFVLKLSITLIRSYHHLCLFIYLLHSSFTSSFSFFNSLLSLSTLSNAIFRFANSIYIFPCFSPCLFLVASNDSKQKCHLLLTFFS